MYAISPPCLLSLPSLCSLPFPFLSLPFPPIPFPPPSLLPPSPFPSFLLPPSKVVFASGSPFDPVEHNNKVK